MAEATEFNLESGIEAKRKQLMTLVNVGTTEPKVWQLLGTGIADSAIEKNGDKTKVTDILGVTRARLNKTEPSQTFTPYTVTGDDELRLQLHNHYRNDRYSELSKYEVAVVYGYVGTADTAMECDVHANCTITLESEGGADYVDSPLTIDFSNDKTLGTMGVSAGVYTFTPDA